jgi:hypothetical protein
MYIDLEWNSSSKAILLFSMIGLIIFAEILTVYYFDVPECEGI